MFSEIQNGSQKPLSFTAAAAILAFTFEHLNMSPAVLDSFRRDLTPVPALHPCSRKRQTQTNDQQVLMDVQSQTMKATQKDSHDTVFPTVFQNPGSTFKS